MAEYHEVFHERLYVKEPRTERLRKSAAGRLRYLLATGWKETERWHADDYITVKMERSGFAPRMTRMPKIEPAPARAPRRGPGQGPPSGPRR
ncbi:MAG TPA: hypothetical protein VGL18_04045 [Actinomycetota bacterium]